MSMHVEWDTAATAEIQVWSATAALDLLAPDTRKVSGPVLVIGGSGGGCIAIESNSVSELEALIRRLQARITEVKGHPAYEGGAKRCASCDEVFTDLENAPDDDTALCADCGD